MSTQHFLGIITTSNIKKLLAFLFFFCFFLGYILEQLCCVCVCVWCCVYSCCDLLVCVEGVWCFPRGWPSVLFCGGSQPICYLRRRAVMPLSAHHRSINSGFSRCYHANVSIVFFLLLVWTIVCRFIRFVFLIGNMSHFLSCFRILPKFYL